MRRLRIYFRDISEKGLRDFLYRRIKKRSWSRRLLYVFTSPTVQIDNTISLLVDKQDTVVSESLLHDHIWEPTETALIKSKLRKGDTVIDIGAHIGYYSLLMAKYVGSSGHVYSFEPDSQNMLFLRKNIQRNGIKQITIVPKAVSDQSTKALLYRDEQNRGNHTLYARGEENLQVNIETITIDEYFGKQRKSISLIKMDIQGFELRALMGMQNVLRRNHAIILVTEFWPYGMHQSGTSAKEFLKILTSLGFKLYEICEEHKNMKQISVERLLQLYTIKNKKETNLLCER